MFILSKEIPKTINLIKDKLNKHFNTKCTGTQRQKNGERIPHQCIKNDNNATIQKYGIRHNIWKYSPGYMKSTTDEFAYDHPAIFPEKLVADHIISWSNENDIVLDPFLGSGTTAKMARHLNRKYIGFEISEDYFKICQKRLSQLNLFNN